MAVGCVRTEELKNIINEATKYLVSNDIIKGSDILDSTNNESFKILAFIAELSTWSFNVIDDTYDYMNKTEENFNKDRIAYGNELERINEKLDKILNWIESQDNSKKPVKATKNDD